MGVTIKDVAQAAGVSAKTVSRVLNDSPSVAKETRQAVLGAMNDLKYHPNASARSLVLSQTGVVGLAIAYDPRFVFGNPYFSEVIRGINDICNGEGYNLLVEARPDTSALTLVRSGKVDGLLYMCTRKDLELTDELLVRNFPFVLIGRDPDEERIPSVEVDDELGGYIAGKHLSDLGYRRLGFIGGSREYVSFAQRSAGFMRALEEAGLSLDKDFVVENEYVSQEEGYQSMHRLLASASRPEAVFVFNDLLALGALRALKEKGADLPGDMGIVGFDNIMPTMYCDPPLTTIEQPAYDKGFIAAQILLKTIRGEDIEDRHLLLRPRLVVRSSCGVNRRSS